MRRILHDNWPMLLALAIAIAIGWLVFTVLRPPTAGPLRGHRARVVAASVEHRSSG